MIMGLQEWPLIIFTVLAQTSIGAFIVLSLPLLFGSLSDVQRSSIQRNLFFIWLMMGVAIIASIMHLGMPLRAFNSLLRVGSSNLSNEIFGATLFLGVGGLYWLIQTVSRLSESISKVWLVLTILAGLYFMYAMCQVYQISTVPTWDTGYTTVNFLMTMLLAGSIFGVLLLRPAIKKCRLVTQILPLVAVGALFVSIGNYYLQSDQLVLLHSSVIRASELIPDYGVMLTWRLVFLVLGLACWLLPLVNQRTSSTFGLMVGVCLVIIGEIIGRTVFYGLHMTVGVV